MERPIITTLSFRAAACWGVSHMAGQPVVLKPWRYGYEATCHGVVIARGVSPQSCRAPGGLPAGWARNRKPGAVFGRPKRRGLRRKYVRNAGFDGQPEVLREFFQSNKWC